MAWSKKTAGKAALWALHLDADIPSEVTARGFRFGHSLLGGNAFEVIHLAFEFYGFRTWNLLINPNNPLVQAVLARMLEDEDYFFFALSPDGRATAFRSEMGQDVLFYVKAHLPRLRHSTTTATQYDLACLAFARNPAPPGLLLHIVGALIEVHLRNFAPKLDVHLARLKGAKPQDGGNF